MLLDSTLFHLTYSGFKGLTLTVHLVAQGEGNAIVVGQGTVVHEHDFTPLGQHSFDNFVDRVIHHVGTAFFIDYLKATFVIHRGAAPAPSFDASIKTTSGWLVSHSLIPS